MFSLEFWLVIGCGFAVVSVIFAAGYSIGHQSAELRQSERRLAKRERRFLKQSK